ncbi:F-box only protein 6-like isoform X2 [Periplaneta americana]
MMSAYLTPLENYLPPEMIINILSYVDAKTLVNLRLVSHSWKHFIDNEVWKLKTSREKYRSLKSVDPKRKLPWFVYYLICVKDPFEKNLLKNHCGQEKLTHWDIISSGGDRWVVEDPPQGAEKLPESEEFGKLTSCFATSYHSCSKEQTIDLSSIGFGSKIMDELQPLIEVSEWYAGRFDCGCIYEMHAVLLNAERKPLHKFERRETVNQWEGRDWYKVSHTFQNYGPGVRFIQFFHGGMDTQFWAGHYGSKMSGACVKIVIPAEVSRGSSCESESESEEHCVTALP